MLQVTPNKTGHTALVLLASCAMAMWALAQSARMKLRLHPHNFQKLFNEEMINLWLKPKL